MVASDGDVVLRELRESDIPKLTEYANNTKVSMNLRDAFPSPYCIPGLTGQCCPDFDSYAVEKIDQLQIGKKSPEDHSNTNQYEHRMLEKLFMKNQ
jgi:hypothetical protein